jgi:hypothetical protein
MRSSSTLLTREEVAAMTGRLEVRELGYFRLPFIPLLGTLRNACNHEATEIVPGPYSTLRQESQALRRPRADAASDFLHGS